ncbi:MAG: zinc-ribbon domain-containing protein [Armatimonadota bacterium]
MAEDKTLKCKDCGQQFTFSVGEQEFYSQMGFENAPVRCAPCRKAKKSQRAQSGQSFGSSAGGASFHSGMGPRHDY